PTTAATQVYDEASCRRSDTSAESGVEASSSPPRPPCRGPAWVPPPSPPNPPWPPNGDWPRNGDCPPKAPRGPPTGPPPSAAPTTVGPALGMAPVCGVAAVSSAYAVGPRSEAAIAPPTTARPTVRLSTGAARIAAAAASPTTSTRVRSSGYQS